MAAAAKISSGLFVRLRIVRKSLLDIAKRQSSSPCHPLLHITILDLSNWGCVKV